MNFHISATQAKDFANELYIADIKKYVSEHLDEYKKFVEYQKIIADERSYI